MTDHYRSLTRTYRPRTFDEIVSQEHVSNTLENAISQNRLAHAYMFCGPRGVGKTTMARVLARSVNDIEADIDGESLNQTLNVIEIDAASNNSVDDIRDLRERVRVPPQNGRYKIYIIDEVHMLSKSAFNALLKTLEEPPDHIIFIFATTEPHKVLPTILSRVQRFDFKRIQVDEIVKRLKKVTDEEGVSIDEESLHVIAKKADGALRDALGLLDQAIAFCGTDIQHEELLRALNVVSTERMFDFMDAIDAQDASAGLELIDELLQEGYDIQEFLIGLTEHLRNLYVAKNSEKMHLVDASPDTKKRYREKAKPFSQDDLIRMLHLVSEAQYKLKEAHQPRIQFEITLLKLIHMEKTQNLNRLLGELEDLKKKLSDGRIGRSEKTNGTNGEQSSEQLTGGSKPREESAPESDLEITGEIDSSETDREQMEETPSVFDETNGTGSDSDKMTDFFGTPSLGTDGKTSEKEERASSAVTMAEEPSASGTPKADPTLEEVNASWDEFLQVLKEEVPQMLYFQMQRIEPSELKNRELFLQCSDDFAKKIIEENRRELGKCLEQVVGVFLRFRCRVRKDKEGSDESLSPYERFKNLQKNDPTIKKLVELFGAELDYNLNR
ncbi:MAG: DNA polymerase III subunit gamma/tau [Balneolaceae bacterium]|nr:DNA polymerase III subunit gamma/tau [Balneolaceae bacterium]